MAWVACLMETTSGPDIAMNQNPGTVMGILDATIPKDEKKNNIWKIIPFDPFHPLPGSSSVPPKNNQSLSIYSPASLDVI